MLNIRELSFSCDMELTAYLIGGKWKIPILWNLRQGALRFGEIKRRLGPITQKMLTQHLRELEECGLVHRRVYDELPLKVEYSLTADAESLLPILSGMCAWGKAYRQKLLAAEEELGVTAAEACCVKSI